MGLSTLPVRHDAASAAVVRRRLAVELGRLSIAQRYIDDVVLVASELVSNAVRHADPVEDHVVDVLWDLEPAAVVIQVEDGSSRTPHKRQSAELQPDGRGLTIVEALAADWGVDRTERGKRVWARVPISM